MEEKKIEAPKRGLAGMKSLGSVTKQPAKTVESHENVQTNDEEEDYGKHLLEEMVKDAPSDVVKAMTLKRRVTMIGEEVGQVEEEEMAEEEESEEEEDDDEVVEKEDESIPIEVRRAEEKKQKRAQLIPSDDPVASTYQIRPPLEERFRSVAVKELIHAVLAEELSGKVYNMAEAGGWTKNISEIVKRKVKDMGMKRYKLIVHVVLGEQKGAGVKVGARCLWDAESDNYASSTYMNDTLFCMVVVFGVYFY